MKDDKGKHIWTPEALHLPEPLVDAFKSLNWNYGKGDFLGFLDFSMTGDNQFIETAHGTAITKLQYGYSRAKFRIVNGTLFFRGHQRTLKDPE